MTHAEQHPHGDARLAHPEEIRRAFSTQGGFPFGFHDDRKLYHSTNAGALLIGGAGSGKFTTVISHIMDTKGVGDSPARSLIFDPKGELGAVVGQGLVHQGAHVYYINPFGLNSLPNHTVSLLAHLKSDSPFLAADARSLAQTLVPNVDGPNGFFSQQAQLWLAATIRTLA